MEALLVVEDDDVVGMPHKVWEAVADAISLCFCLCSCVTAKAESVNCEGRKCIIVIEDVEE